MDAVQANSTAPKPQQQQQPTENPFFQEPVPEKKKNILVDIVQSVIIALSISIFLYIFIITPNEVDGPSMEPNFQSGELLFTSQLHAWFNGTSVGDALGFNYQRGDVVVFQKPGNDDFVKRIIALPGETIRIEDGRFYVNGDLMQENYELDNDRRLDGSFLVDGAQAVTVPEDKYFVAGDHRDVSFDSRSLGFINDEWIKGRVILRFWPVSEFSYIGHGSSEFVEAPETETTTNTQINLGDS